MHKSNILLILLLHALFFINLPLLNPASLPIRANNISSLKITMLSVGSTHSCVITNAGAAKCWGKNENGQLGDGTKIDKFSPIDVAGLHQSVIAISNGFRHTCALVDDGKVKCWGENTEGQLGDGSNNNSLTPINVIDLEDVKSISAGQFHNCAVLKTGRVKCWGRNTYGSLGDGTKINKNRPVDVANMAEPISAITTGEQHTCALTITGHVKCWGWNEAGTLGDASNLNRLTPVDVIALEDTVISIASRTYHTCALLSNGIVKCWGFNRYGQLGDGSTEDKSSPIVVQGLNKAIIAIGVGGGTSNEEGGANNAHTCAISADGAGQCWGSNTYSQLGNYDFGKYLTPVNINGLTDSLSIGLGGGNTCVLTHNNSVKCWGFNGNGRLGDGTDILRNSPVFVKGWYGNASLYLPLTSNNLCNDLDCEPNNNFDAAAQITSNILVNGNVDIRSDSNDYYKVFLQAHKTYKFQLTFAGNSDLDLYVYDSYRNEVAKSKLDGNALEQVVFSPSISGNYYVLVTAFKAENIQAYELSVAEP